MQEATGDWKEENREIRGNDGDSLHILTWRQLDGISNVFQHRSYKQIYFLIYPLYLSINYTLCIIGFNSHITGWGYVSWVLLTPGTIELGYKILWPYMSQQHMFPIRNLGALMCSTVWIRLASGLESGFEKWASKWVALWSISGAEIFPKTTWLNLLAAQSLSEMEISDTLGHCSFILTTLRKFDTYKLPLRSLDKYLAAEWKFLLVPMSWGQWILISYFIFISSKATYVDMAPVAGQPLDSYSGLSDWLD
jgi:hypothetical protein